MGGLSERHGSRLTWTLAGLAVCLFGPLFAIRGIGAFDFWWWMSANAALLLNVTSHVVWDLAVFLIFPFGWS